VRIKEKREPENRRDESQRVKSPFIWHLTVYSHETARGDSLCGNGVLAQDEECDDGNTLPLDGCSYCKIDPFYMCTMSWRHPDTPNQRGYMVRHPLHVNEPVLTRFAAYDFGNSLYDFGNCVFIMALTVQHTGEYDIIPGHTDLGNMRHHHIFSVR